MPAKKTRKVTKKPVRKVSKKPSKYYVFYQQNKKLCWGIFIFLLLSYVTYRNRYRILSYFRLDSGYVIKNLPQSNKEKQKIKEVFSSFRGNAFGIDISQYQGKIEWDSVQLIQGVQPIDFALVRATMSISRKDKYFDKNWQKLADKNIIRGAYHFYDANKSSTEQAENFIQKVELQSGDLPPILDIEKLSRIQSNEELKRGIFNWLHLVENHYHIKPIIYSYDYYFLSYFKPEELEGYVIWVANYNPVDRPIFEKWDIWQFSEKGLVKGVHENYVDLNVYQGTVDDLRDLTID